MIAFAYYPDGATGYDRLQKSERHKNCWGFCFGPKVFWELSGVMGHCRVGRDCCMGIGTWAHALRCVCEWCVREGGGGQVEACNQNDISMGSSRCVCA